LKFARSLKRKRSIVRLAIAKFMKKHNVMLAFGEFGTLGQKMHFKKFLIFISRSTQSIKHSHSYIVGACSKTCFNGVTCGKLEDDIIAHEEEEIY